MQQYRLGQKKGDGTFSEVFKATNIESGQSFAIKCMKKQYDSAQKVKKLPEIQALHILSPHQNIIRLHEVLHDEHTGKLALVFELMEENLYEYSINNRESDPMRMKYYMYSLLKALAWVHKKGVFHRDLKPQNVLVAGNDIKLADFGSCKNIQANLPFTEYISTRWYRSPQCLLTDGYYSHKMDIWGYGCILFQMVSRYPLFNGKNELDQIHKINKIIGNPSEELIAKFKVHATHMKAQQWHFQKHKGISFSRLLPHSPKQLIDLLNKMVVYDPQQRIQAQQGLFHPYFQDLQSFIKLERLSLSSVSMNTSKKMNQNHDEQSKRNNEETKSKISYYERGLKFKVEAHSQSKGLPPINNIKIELKTNPFNETSTSKFKKTNRPSFISKIKH